MWGGQVCPVERVQVRRPHPLAADDALGAQPMQDVADALLGVPTGDPMHLAAGQ
jgi:hypothetical protein